MPRWLYGVVVTATIVVTLLEGVPWLSIDENLPLDSNNPYSTLFSVTNGGYFPITNLEAICTATFETGAGTEFRNYKAYRGRFADYLAHGGRATLPCFHAVELRSGILKTAELEVVITYSIYPLTLKALQRRQVFNFKAVRALNGSLHWTFVS